MAGRSPRLPAGPPISTFLPRLLTGERDRPCAVNQLDATVLFGALVQQPLVNQDVVARMPGPARLSSMAPTSSRM